MPSRLPSLLTHLDLPYPELQAAVRDGDLVALDESFTPIDVPPSAAIRAQSLHELLDGVPLVAELDSAAWIHGARAEPPRVHRLCVNIEARLRLVPTARRRVREVVLPADDVTHIAKLAVTSPIRTAIDLLREPTVFTHQLAEMVRALMVLNGVTHDDVVTRLTAWARAPHKLRAIERLTALHAASPATNI